MNGRRHPGQRAGGSACAWRMGPREGQRLTPARRDRGRLCGRRIHLRPGGKCTPCRKLSECIAFTRGHKNRLGATEDLHKDYRGASGDSRRPSRAHRGGDSHRASPTRHAPLLVDVARSTVSRRQCTPLREVRARRQKSQPQLRNLDRRHGAAVHTARGKLMDDCRLTYILRRLCAQPDGHVRCVVRRFCQARLNASAACTVVTGTELCRLSRCCSIIRVRTQHRAGHPRLRAPSATRPHYDARRAHACACPSA